MQSKILFREASEEDSFDLAMMRWDFTQEEGALLSTDKALFINSCATQIIHGLVSGQWVCFIAEKQDEILAHVFCCQVPKIPRPDHVQDAFGYVTNVYTKPEHRNNGLGSELLVRAKEWATQKNLELLIVWPSDESQNFYERAGFKQANNIFCLQLRQDKTLSPPYGKSFEEK